MFTGVVFVFGRCGTKPGDTARGCGGQPANETDCPGNGDEDCDGCTDCEDSDCAADPACSPAGCGANGDPCTDDGDCCSIKCKNGTCRGN